MKALGEDGHLQAQETGLGPILPSRHSDGNCPADTLVLDFILTGTDLHCPTLLGIVFAHPFIPLRSTALPMLSSPSQA